MFRPKADGEFVALCVLNSDIDTAANSLKEVLLSLKRSLGDTRKIQPWVAVEVLGLYDQRRQLKQEKYTSTEAGLEYRKVNREVGKKMKAVKEEWVEKQARKQREGKDVRIQQRGLLNPLSYRQDPTA